MAFVMARCPACKKLQPHNTAGVDRENDGREFQTMICTICNTSSKVYTGKDGEDFQANYDHPDDTDLSEIE